jgi:hypothetical protein
MTNSPLASVNVMMRETGITNPNAFARRWTKIYDLRGKVTLTTGASSGIGAAIAREAAARGAFSLLVGRNAEKLAAVERILFARRGGTRRHTPRILQALTKSNFSDRAW